MKAPETGDAPLRSQRRDGLRRLPRPLGMLTVARCGISGGLLRLGNLAHELNVRSPSPADVGLSLDVAARGEDALERRASDA